ncbi:MAG: hypothetical protein GXP47_01200 [Acidobacteria bacterium]|nr:hypothetical protein [Acidobacteriota bacterium]
MIGEIDLFEAAAAMRRQGERAVLAALVAVEGSSVRRPGARLLILPDGRLAGFLSAGCVEADLAARVERVLSTGHAETVRYDAAGLDDPVLGLGLGCGGTMTVLLEPWPPEERPDPLAVAETVARTRRPAGLATVIAPSETLGARAVMTPAGGPEVSAPPRLSGLLEELSRQAIRGAHGIHRIGGTDVFLERIDPPLRLLIHGDTPPALALGRLAEVLGWATVFVEPPGGSSPAAAPARPGILPAGFEPDPWTVAALLAHDTAAETRLVPALLSGGMPYVGVMGSRGRRERLVAALQDGGIPAGALERLRMPIGLDLGAESAAEIALAAAAEILSVLRSREGGRLSRTTGPIHDR